MLCEWCSRIPFDLNVLDTRLGTGFTLGSGARLVKSQCLFRQLVVCATSEAGDDESEYLHVKMNWTLGPSGYYAFKVSHALGSYTAFRRTAVTSFGRKPLSIEPTGPHVETARVLRWISSCELAHRPRCELSDYIKFADAFRGLRLLRLIDIKKGCLVEMRAREKYVALSYVWGAVSNFRLTKANRIALLAPVSLMKISHRLPRTVQDAIALVRRLGCRYLWVDAHCLLQNDNEDLDRGVNAMDRIYEFAWLTVVASCGHDANARLPGVLSPAGHPLQSKSSLVGAWTFQEQVLSRRAIYFVGDKLFYRCRAAEYSEHYTDIPSQHLGIDSTLGSVLSAAVLMERPIADYGTMLSYYTQRALTDQKDTPRAMAGIIRRSMGVMRCQPTAVLTGLSSFMRTTAFYSAALSFQVIHGQAAEEVSGYHEDANEWLRSRTWIIWYKRSRAGNTSLVWDSRANHHFRSRDVTCVGNRERVTFSNGREIFNKQGSPTGRTMPTEEVSFSRAVPAYPILQFWTLWVCYIITDIDVFEATGYLADSNGVKCGFALLDGFEETSFFDFSSPFEVILLSEAQQHHDLRKVRSFGEASYPKVPGR
ncbi:hypothetical protein H2204_009937 [Knufia peltigerae]|uniref:Heterokaryon incompatibility domain-containing protein n=1 Tax=Knufia peltigerae TaxID=1002370 RepID=A0AA38XYF2_9EURO|nr:hypothetical protein H2204_009937 [Knufia peltigerae]